MSRMSDTDLWAIGGMRAVRRRQRAELLELFALPIIAVSIIAFIKIMPYLAIIATISTVGLLGLSLYKICKNKETGSEEKMFDSVQTANTKPEITLEKNQKLLTTSFSLYQNQTKNSAIEPLQSPENSLKQSPKYH